ncbi:MAG TPA: phosphate acyltransferase [Blastocatellia bacterium]|nr:phosphate acyltransferase [Blastocatellia bacterium]
MTSAIYSFDEMVEHARLIPGKRIVVAGGDNRAALEAVIAAAAEFRTETLVVGRRDRIHPLLRSLKADLPILDCSDDAEIAREAVARIRAGQGDILLKGSVDTATVMRAVLDSTSGLRTGQLLSDVFLFENPARQPNRLMMITDGGINVSPGLAEKIEIIRNAVRVAQVLGWEMPRVALLSATEKVTPAIPSTLEAAVISKMNERGQIPGCLIEGPLALDLAVAPEAAEAKGISSPVVGRADILVAPNIEVANVLAKSTVYFARFRLAHVTVGASVPVLIPSRSDSAEAKFLSIALGLLMRAREGVSPSPESPPRPTQTA